MGAIYRPKYRGRQGVIGESEVWWVRFRQHGKTVRQYTETYSEAKARAFLREREGKVALNIPVAPRAGRLTLRGRRARLCSFGPSDYNDDASLGGGYGTGQRGGDHRDR